MIKLLYVFSSFMLIISLVSFVIVVLPPAEKIFKPTAQINLKSEIKTSIDFSCQKDSDCQIKDVGNQCGYYPMCVNKDFIPQSPELDSMICGFPSINQCRCLKNKCQGF